MSTKKWRVYHHHTVGIALTIEALWITSIVLWWSIAVGGGERKDRVIMEHSNTLFTINITYFWPVSSIADVVEVPAC